MPRSDRAPSFQFYPGDFLSDPAVAAMSFDERGRFWWALCWSWQTDRPGEGSEMLWRDWCGYSEDEWPAHRAALARAFAIRPDGVWVQKRTVEVRKAQLERQRRAREGASATNEKRWGKVAERSTKRSDSDRSKGRSRVSPASASASASACEKESSRSARPADAATKANGRPEWNPAPLPGSSVLGRLEAERAEATADRENDPGAAARAAIEVRKMVEGVGRA